MTTLTAAKQPTATAGSVSGTRTQERVTIDATSVGRSSIEERNAIVVDHIPLIRYVAKRVKQSYGLPAGVELSDLVSYGVLGLLEAHERYKEGTGASFETFAIPRIRGAMLDALRRYDWVPRNVRTRARRLNEATAKLAAQLGRHPTRDEVAEAMGIEELHDFEKISTPATMLGLDDVVTASSAGSLHITDTLADDEVEKPGQALEAAERRTKLLDALTKLNERERLILTLYYFEAVPLGDIAGILGVTESRVSQLHTRALATLRPHLQDVA